MAHFFPALAHTDNVGYFDIDNRRNLMSIRKLMPPAMSKQFLTSLSFDESIHYASNGQYKLFKGICVNHHEIFHKTIDRYRSIMCKTVTICYWCGSVHFEMCVW